MKQSVFVNDQLTPQMQQILYRGRMLKKEGKISSVYTRNGKVLAKVNQQDNSKIIRHTEDYSALYD